jgi:hypothetical protein
MFPVRLPPFKTEVDTSECEQDGFACLSERVAEMQLLLEHGRASDRARAYDIQLESTCTTRCGLLDDDRRTYNRVRDATETARFVLAGHTAASAGVDVRSMWWYQEVTRACAYIAWSFRASDLARVGTIELPREKRAFYKSVHAHLAELLEPDVSGLAPVLLKHVDGAWRHIPAPNSMRLRADVNMDALVMSEPDVGAIGFRLSVDVPTGRHVSSRFESYVAPIFSGLPMVPCWLPGAHRVTTVDPLHVVAAIPDGLTHVSVEGLEGKWCVWPIPSTNAAGAVISRGAAWLLALQVMCAHRMEVMYAPDDRNPGVFGQEFWARSVDPEDDNPSAQRIRALLSSIAAIDRGSEGNRLAVAPPTYNAREFIMLGIGTAIVQAWRTDATDNLLTALGRLPPCERVLVAPIVGVYTPTGNALGHRGVVIPYFENRRVLISVLVTLGACDPDIGEDWMAAFKDAHRREPRYKGTWLSKYQAHRQDLREEAAKFVPGCTKMAQCGMCPFAGRDHLKVARATDAVYPEYGCGVVGPRGRAKPQTLARMPAASQAQHLCFKLCTRNLTHPPTRTADTPEAAPSDRGVAPFLRHPTAFCVGFI